ncbi:hypothetical protein LTR05_000936 [Lithohypha guttulata]|uniref:Uncharacterized protein n=1 Tax=Lithohypha guttulata TaxID=1690604 RepID=A0AAN7T6Y1_9EURO|nr:hypothetical protein LTR05_000936 [Lithohypha guttulata]
MSQSRDFNIVDFFRPRGQMLPKKRPTPEPDHDTIVLDINTNAPATPSSIRTVKHDTRKSRHAPSRSASRSVTTPRSDRRISISIRSPSSKLPTPAQQPTPVEPSTQERVNSPNLSSSFSVSNVPNSSRRVVKDDKLLVVLDSDSDDSLEDLTEIFSRKKKTTAHASSSKNDKAMTAEEEGTWLLSMFTGGLSDTAARRQKIRQLKRTDQANSLSMSSIFAEEVKDREAQKRMAEANAEVETSAKEVEAMREAERDKKMLAAILKGDDGGATTKDLERLVDAVDRTEVLAGERVFSFFDRLGPRASTKRRSKKVVFPKEDIPASLWKPEDVDSQNRAYLSGWMADLTESGALSDEALQWTFDSALTEVQDELQESYLNCLSIASSQWTRANVTPSDVHSAFSMLGAKPEALQDASPIRSHAQARRPFRQQEFKPLLKVLRTFAAICRDMDFVTLSKLCSTLSRLALDDVVMDNNQICEVVEDLLQRIASLPDPASRNHVHERLLSDLAENLTEPALQTQFLRHFTPTTSTVAQLRLCLAASFSLGSKRARKFIAQPSLSFLATYVSKSPHFAPKDPSSTLTTAEDYRNLTCLTTLLDATIADGYPPSTFASRSDENDFNADVDSLSDTIHSLFVSIADTGASHMHRTKAKDALQALHCRLVYSVRTTTKPRKHVFDTEGKFVGVGRRRSVLQSAEEVGSERRGRQFMKDFLRKKQDRIRQEEEEEEEEGDDEDEDTIVVNSVVDTFVDAQPF